MPDTHLHREIAHIAVPVSLETMFQLLLGFIDQVIIGTLGTVAIAAVGLCNSVLAVVYVTLGALGTGTGILVARAHGGGQAQVVARTSSTAAALAGASSLLLALPFVALAGPFLKGLGAAPAVAAAGRTYFPVVLLMLPLATVGAVASATLRSLGRPRIPLAVTLLAVALNTAGAYVLVFGVGPFPRLGLAGAAWATFAAQAVKALLLLRCLYGGRALARWELPPTLAEWRRTNTELLHLAVPLGAKDVSWTFALFGYALLYQRIGTGALAASQIVATLENLFFLASIGLMVAATTLIGQAVGSGDASLAQMRARILLRTGAVTGLAFGALYLSMALLLPIFYPHVGRSVLSIAAGGVVISALFQPVRVRNMILGGGVLPSGGDARSVVIGDALGAFAVGLPLAFLLGFALKWGVWGVFAARGVEEVSKALFFARRAGRLSWAKVAVRPAGA